MRSRARSPCSGRPPSSGSPPRSRDSTAPSRSRPRASSSARSCCGSSRHSTSPTRSCARRSTRRSARSTAPRHTAGPRACSWRPAPSRSGPRRHLLLVPPAADPFAVSVLREAARSALARGAASEAVVYLRRALAEPPAPSERGDLLGELGAIERSVDLPAAIEHLREAVGLIDEPQRFAEVSIECGRALAYAGLDSAEAIERYRAAIDRAGRERPDLVEVATAELINANWAEGAFIAHGEGADRRRPRGRAHRRVRERLPPRAPRPLGDSPRRRSRARRRARAARGRRRHARARVDAGHLLRDRRPARGRRDRGGAGGVRQRPRGGPAARRPAATSAGCRAFAAGCSSIEASSVPPSRTCARASSSAPSTARPCTSCTAPSSSPTTCSRSASSRRPSACSPAPVCPSSFRTTSTS